MRDRSKQIPVCPEFQGTSYLERYNILCKKLVQEQLDTTTVLASPATAADGAFSDVSEMTSLKTSVTSFAGHIAGEAARYEG
ncbi:MAG: PaeR7I family type II restriction endonuclease [Opitutaceae bacterium]